MFKKSKPKTELPVRRLFPDSVLPKRAYKDDAGLDLASAEDVFVAPGAVEKIETGIVAQIPPAHVGLILPRSSMNEKGVICPVGVIDSGYVGTLKIVLINHSGTMARIRARQRVAQLVIVPIAVLTAVEVATVESNTPRGEQGFGSSGSN